MTEGYDEKKYMHIGLDDLVTYAVFSLNNKMKEATFENLVVECFELFPKRFSLIGYPMYPDSSLVNKSWLRCRTDKHFIEGSASKGFKLTIAGFDIAEKVSFMLKDQTIQPAIEKRKSEARSRAGKFVSHIEKSSAYRKYLETPNIPRISDFELRDLLLGTMQTSPEILIANVEQFTEYAKIKERKDLMKFLDYIDREIEKRFCKEKGKPKYSGGMNKKLIP